MDLIILGVFSFLLHRTADRLNLSPWRWVIRYMLSFLFVTILFIAIMFSIYGEELTTEAGVKILLQYSPIIYLVQFLLYLLYRRNIQRYSTFLDKKDGIMRHIKEKDENKKDDGDDEEKDLSYFR